MRLSEAVELYLTSVSGRCTPRTKLKYEQELNYFINYFGDKYPVEEITPADCIAFLSQWNHRAAKTKAIKHTVLRQLFSMLEKIDTIPSNPMLKIDYPKVPPIEDRGVKSMSFQDVQKMFASCHTWTEKLCIGVLAYMGVRRAAANNLRWKDVDLEAGYITFKEKGQKTIRKPIPLPLLELLKSYRDISTRHLEGIWTDEMFSPVSENEYVIPSEAQTYTDPRNDRFIWRVVKRVGERAGVDTHCHAFRAAFAVHYLESHDNDTIGLQELMGHNHFETTKAYLRRLNREKAMERVRDLDWGVSLTASSSLTPETVLLGVPDAIAGTPSSSQEAVSAASEGVSLTPAGAPPVHTESTGKGNLGGCRDRSPVGVSEDALKGGVTEQGQSDVLDTSPAGIDPLEGLPLSPALSAPDAEGQEIASERQSNSMTPKKLRGRDSNPNSTTVKVSSKSPAKQSSTGRKVSGSNPSKRKTR